MGIKNMNHLCHHIGIFTNNPEDMILFYTEKLGFERGVKKIVPEAIMVPIFGLSSSCSLTKLTSGHMTIEVLCPEGSELKEGKGYSAGYNHWGLGVQDKEAFCNELQRRGVHIIRVENNGRYICFIKDPDGNLIELYEER